MQSNPFNKQNFNLTAATRFGKLGRWMIPGNGAISMGGLIAFDGGKHVGGVSI